MISPIANAMNGTADQLSLLHAMDSALHDLSQPLTSIACAMELIGREPDRESSGVMLALAAHECHRAMQQVIRSRELLAGALGIATQPRKDLA